MLEVKAPIQRTRKSSYSSALKTRRSTPPRSLGEGLFAVDEMEDVAIAVGEEYEPVALVHVRFRQKLDPPVTQTLVGGIKVSHHHGEMADAGVLHVVGSALAGRRDDLQQRTVSSPHEE